MKNVLQILGVFFIGALIGFILMGFGLSVDVSLGTTEELHIKISRSIQLIFSSLIVS